jgi:hypothetical protein
MSFLHNNSLIMYIVFTFLKFRNILTAKTKIRMKSHKFGLLLQKQSVYALLPYKIVYDARSVVSAGLALIVPLRLLNNVYYFNKA